MVPLVDWFRTNSQHTPQNALLQLIQSWQLGQGQFNAAMQSGAATPNASFNGPQQFASPAGAHLGLPNTGSPASMNMSPAMHAHALQQSGSSQGVSANTSPNVTNKRRRASQVKMEADGDTPEANGPRVKQSPRVPKKAKPGS